INIVFTLANVSDIQYKKRQDMKLESKLLKALKIEEKIAVITGKSKIGKTELVNKVINPEKRVEIQAKDIEERLDVSIAKALKYPTDSKIIETLEKEDQNKLRITDEMSGGFKFFYIIINNLVII